MRTTSNGGVDISGASAGDARGCARPDGSVHADLRKGNFDAHTTNGSITARLMEADSIGRCAFRAPTGHIELSDSRGAQVHADTSNSSITVRMPSSINANVRAHTSNASITSDFDVSVHGGRMSKHSLEGTIGSGGPVLDLERDNGGDQAASPVAAVTVK